MGGAISKDDMRALEKASPAARYALVVDSMLAITGKRRCAHSGSILHRAIFWADHDDYSDSHPVVYERTRSGWAVVPQ